MPAAQLMTTSERRRYTLTEQNRAWVGSFILTLEPGYVVTVSPPGRSLSQNDLFHSLVDQIAKAKPEWNGMAMTADDWKQLLVLSFAMATDGGGIRLTKDLEGRGLIQLRESTARMSKERANDLISYAQAWAAQNGVRFQAEEREAG
jgi:hypothetical protein